MILWYRIGELFALLGPKQPQHKSRFPHRLEPSHARPLTGEAHTPEREERAPLVMRAPNEYAAQTGPRCEYGKAPFFEGECQHTGEVMQSDGSLLCMDHAKLIRLEEREYALLGRTFEMDSWLDQPHNRADDLHWRRVRRQRDEAVEQLRFNRTLIEGHRTAYRQR